MSEHTPPFVGVPECLTGWSFCAKKSPGQADSSTFNVQRSTQVTIQSFDTVYRSIA